MDGDNNYSIDAVSHSAPNQHQTEPPSEKSAKKRGCFGFMLFFSIAFFLIIALAVCFFVGIALINMPVPSMSEMSLYGKPVRFNEEYVAGNNNSKSKIAVIEVNGVILQGSNGSWSQYANANQICEQLRYIKDDLSVRAVIIKLDTPGGEVVASDVIYHNIAQLRNKIHIPVVACMGSMAASGGYYIAVGCDYIIANRLTTTGSIGVIIQAYDYYELFKKIGLQAEVYKSGAMKDMLNGARPRTPEEIKIVQNLVDEVYNEFVKLVAVGRPKLSVSQIKNSKIGDGRVFTGAQALKLGLVDQLGFFEDAVAKADELAGLGGDYKVIRYKKQFSIAQLFSEMKSDSNKVIKVDLPGDKSWFSAISPGKLYFLPSCR